MTVERVSVTDTAKAVIDTLRAKHGELIFHQSGGCCDGSAPMCFEKGEFLIGARDLCLGEIHGCKFYMASDQFEYVTSAFPVACHGVSESFGKSEGNLVWNDSSRLAARSVQYYKKSHIMVDVSEGRGSSFSLEIPLGLRFMAVSRVFTDEELEELEELK